MKYLVTYRLFHPQYIPAVSIAVMEAYSHAELDAKVARIKTKWQARDSSLASICLTSRGSFASPILGGLHTHCVRHLLPLSPPPCGCERRLVDHGLDKL
jgi:hypothetical protein